MAQVVVRLLVGIVRGHALGPVLALAFLAAPLPADDWPQWRGEGRRGVWKEAGILDKFPEDGLKLSWRTLIATGYSGPAVAGRRIFVTDFVSGRGREGVERAVCLDASDAASQLAPDVQRHEAGAVFA